MKPITIPPPVWPPMKDGQTETMAGPFLLRVRAHPRHPSDLRWSVVVLMEIVAASNGYAPMEPEEAQAAAWTALGEWLRGRTGILL